jgi:hypothetical protein
MRRAARERGRRSIWADSGPCGANRNTSPCPIGSPIDSYGDVFSRCWLLGLCPTFLPTDLQLPWHSANRSGVRLQVVAIEENGQSVGYRAGVHALERVVCMRDRQLLEMRYPLLQQGMNLVKDRF